VNKAALSRATARLSAGVCAGCHTTHREAGAERRKRFGRVQLLKEILSFNNHGEGSPDELGDIRGGVSVIPDTWI
jgi:mono/diheme cytochrome c family protein